MVDGQSLNRSALTKSDFVIALLLFASLLFVYSISVPPSFNTRYENRRYFDSDGEFITRQFFQKKTYTHNDHLLYHLLASGLYRLTATPPAQPYDSVPQHRWLSIVAGSLGVTVLFLFGRRFCRSKSGGLAAALLIGGCAGWWYFAATIDTYLPHLVLAIAALGFALMALERQRHRDYAFLGTFMGLAFLFRTDAFLLAALGVVAFAAGWRKAASRLAVCATFGVVFGLLPYAVLAHNFYNVPWSAIPAWASLPRQDAAVHKWGTLNNVRKETLLLAAANQAVYTVILPGLELTRDPHPIALFQKTAALVVLLLYAVLLVLVFIRALQLRRWWWIALSILWFLSRTTFYAWWDPEEPFLFACLSLPALWMLIVTFVEIPPSTSNSTTSRYAAAIRIAFVFVVAVIFWWHNYHTMIVPLRESTLLPR
jgi:hypothetical protein